MSAVPKFEPHCNNSWIAVSRETGKPVFETYRRKTAEHINQERYEVVTAHQWLARITERKGA